jgi:hypothetical protein
VSSVKGRGSKFTITLNSQSNMIENPIQMKAT